MIRLHSYFRSSSAYRVRIALNIKGLEHEIVPVHLLKDGGEQRKESFLSKNPMGQIPYLENGGYALAQSLPILQYLDELQPDPPLFSADSKVKYKQIEVCELINSGIQPIQNLKVLQYLKSNFDADQDKLNEWCRHWIDNGFTALERKLNDSAGKYAFGDETTAVDCFIVPQVFNANRFKVDMQKFPTISKVNENCMGLDVFQAAQPSAQADAE